MLPLFSGRPIRVEMRRSLGNHLAATSIPRRLILLDRALLGGVDFERILIHELFHFSWVRLSNQTRWNWEELLRRELTAGVKGELGWSAEWRKDRLTRRDIKLRAPRWRRYICESFCDTAASYFGGLEKHEEFTLPMRQRRTRAAWLSQRLPSIVIL